MAKPMDEVLEFLRSFISGGVNQDFKPWASELYQKLYRASGDPSPPRELSTVELLAERDRILGEIARRVLGDPRQSVSIGPAVNRTPPL